ncbi:hypothetical protein CHARACLAT_033513 [Characodon lateralis]|uniref:Uncharacterized protein n=1 Tax=Characodon lateralis TaxID=208331 RepID=A0ABU7E8U6_9TELE|nr:hypothetical protein [Characodon lateralis]
MPANQHNMPPFTTEDFEKLLQKLAVLEMKIHRLEVNVEVNMGYNDDSTLPVIPNSDSLLNNSAGNQNTENKPTGRPPWHVLGACPKNQGGRLTGRSQQLNKLEWPELQRNAPVSPGKRRLRQRAAVTTTDRSKTAGNNGVPLQNRFAPLQNENQENDPSSENNKRFENNLHSKQSSPKLPEKSTPPDQES